MKKADPQKGCVRLIRVKWREELGPVGLVEELVQGVGVREVEEGLVPQVLAGLRGQPTNL